MSKSPIPPQEWAALLVDAVSRPGVIAEAYSRFWQYSVGNQFLALFQCAIRRLQPGPLNTFNGWKKLGRSVKRGEKAIILCMPLTVKAKGLEAVPAAEGKDSEAQRTRTIFVYRARWFVLSQTDGEPYVAEPLPEWKEEWALSALNIHRVPFQHLDGNTQGYAFERSVSISPVAFAPERTLFHELAHVVLEHTSESKTSPEDRRLHEVEAECVALIVMESLGRTQFAAESRGYIQHYLAGSTIPDRSAQRIFKAADRILRAGRDDPTTQPPKGEAS